MVIWGDFLEEDVASVLKRPCLPLFGGGASYPVPGHGSCFCVLTLPSTPPAQLCQTPGQQIL